MVCLACHTTSGSSLCNRCRGTLRAPPDRLLPGGIRVVAAFQHEGAARKLVHLLKYQGLVHFARLAADLVESRLPELPFMPIPRAWSRRVKYGVDPAFVIARELSARTGQPVIHGLRPPIHTSRRAGGDHHRRVIPFRTRGIPTQPVILVDDVVTTGGTVLAAARAVGAHQVALAVAANVVPEVTSLPPATHSSEGRS